MKLYNPGTGGSGATKLPNGQFAHLEKDVPCVRVPAVFSEAEVWMPCPDEAVILPLQGHGFFIIKKGDWFEAPPGVSADTIKAMAPHLQTEEECKKAAPAPAVAPASAPAGGEPSPPPAPAEEPPFETAEAEEDKWKPSKKHSWKEK